MKLNYRELMDRCFELAEEAKLRGDSAVGSLIVDADGKIVTEASEQNRTQDIFAHAELLAIRQAISIRHSDDLTRFTLVTTNEPCFLCSFAIRRTSISRVICSKRTLEIGGISSSYPILTANDINNWKTTPEIVFISEN